MMPDKSRASRPSIHVEWDLGMAHGIDLLFKMAFQSVLTGVKKANLLLVGQTGTDFSHSIFSGNHANDFFNMVCSRFGFEISISLFGVYHFYY